MQLIQQFMNIFLGAPVHGVPRVVDRADQSRRIHPPYPPTVPGMARLLGNHRPLTKRGVGVSADGPASTPVMDGV
jgi:hypothetical protein